MRYVFLLKIAVLALRRSWRATLALSVMIISAVAALVFLSAMAIATNDTMIRNSTGLYTGHIIGRNIDKGEDLDRLHLAGVDKVLVRREQRVLLSGPGGLEPLLLVAIDPPAETLVTAFPRKTIAGRYPAAGELTLYLSEETAHRLAVGVGGAVFLADLQGKPQGQRTVCGIYRTGISHFDQGLAFCPRNAFPAGDAETTIAAFLSANAPLDGIVTSYRNLFPGASFKTWEEFMPDLKQLIDLDAICMAILIVLVFAIVSIGIGCAFLIFTLKNLRDHGIMKAMGILPAETAWLLTCQVGLMTLAASVYGTVIGIGLVLFFGRTGIDIGAFTSHNQYFTVSGILYPRLTPLTVAAPPLTAAIFGLLAALWPILYVTRRNPADILRNV